jgi:four helix bundle protein
MSFSHEKLNVYQRSIEFIKFVHKIAISIKINAFEQLDRAATSIPLNIAEGTGKYTSKDKCRYYDIARGSALECAACLDVLKQREKISKEVCEEGKSTLIEIVSMLTGLIKSSSDRVYENQIDYEVKNPDNEYF